MADTGGTFSWLGTEDVGNSAKADLAPAVLSFQEMPREGRKVADNGCFSNRQALASYFSEASWSLLFFPWSRRGSCMLSPGVYAAAPAILLPTEF